MENLLFEFKTAYIVDIVVVLFILIFAIVCGKKGFIGCIFKFLSVVGALAVALIFAGKVGGLVNSAWGFTDKLAAKISPIFEKIPGFTTDLKGLPIDEVEQLLSASWLPSSLQSELSKIVEGLKTLETLTDGQTLASLTAVKCAETIIKFACGIVLYIVSKILLNLLSKILTKIVNSSELGSSINVWLGVLIGLLESFAIVCAVVAVVSIIPSESVSAFVNETVLVKYLYGNNPIMLLLEAIGKKGA